MKKTGHAAKVDRIAERGKKRIDDICEARKRDPEDRQYPEPRRYPLRLRQNSRIDD